MSKEEEKEKRHNELAPEIYINSAGIILSIYDVTLDFGTIDEDNKHQSIVKIKMSPQHAKVMSLMMSNNIAKYENDIGEIVIPEEFLKGKIKQGE